MTDVGPHGLPRLACYASTIREDGPDQAEILLPTSSPVTASIMRSRRRTVSFALMPTLAVSSRCGDRRACVRLRDAASKFQRSNVVVLAHERDAFLGYRGKPNSRQSMGPDEEIVHSADGFRDRRSLEEIGRMRSRHLVICIGESSTYGLGAGDTSGTYPAQLEGALRRLSNDNRWVVFNAGMPGYTSHEALVLTNLRLAKLRPTVVIAMNMRNDYVFAGHYLDA